MLARIHTMLIVLQHKTDGKHQHAEILLTNKIYIYTLTTSVCNKYEVLYLEKTTHMQVHVRSKNLVSFYIVFDFLFVCQLQYFEATRKTIIIDI